MTFKDNVVRLRDDLVSFVTGLGTWKDPTNQLHYQLNVLNRNQVENAYRSDWISRKIVDCPAEDATREWRQWTASEQQVELLEAAEKTFDLQKKLRQAIVRARLYGGAALVLGVEQGDTMEPLQIDKVGKDDLKFVVVMNRYELMAGPRIYNVESPWYTYPEYFTVSTPMFGFYGESGNTYPGNAPYKPGDTQRQVTPVSGQIRIHPSRVVQLAGNELPDWRLIPLGGMWGDSILQVADEILKDYGLTVGSIANMVNDAKMDVVKIPNFATSMSTAEYAGKLINRFSLANQAKSSVNTLLLDKEEEWERIQTNFGTLPQILQMYMTIACAAGNVPFSRVFGQMGSRGLGQGQSQGGGDDLNNYYDWIASQQKTIYTPALDPLDQVLIRSALGKFDPNVFYEWRSLRQPDPKEVAAIALQKAQTTQIYVMSGLFNEDVLRAAVVNQLDEEGTYPGLADAVDKFGLEPEDGDIDPRTGQPVGEPPPVSAGPNPGSNSEQQDAWTEEAREASIEAREAKAKHLYHVTFTKNVPKIREQGLKTKQTSNWVKAGDKSRYGKGEVYAFENETDAQRWAGRMDWDNHQETGSGKISILKVDASKNKWEEDHNDPLSQSASKGKWLKTKSAIKPEAILESKPFDKETVRALVQRTNSGDAQIADATPRTLYVRRDVLNGDVIRHWAKQQGFETTLEPSDMHVTIAFSRTPVDWTKAGEAPPSGDNPDEGWLTIPPGGARQLQVFGTTNDAGPDDEPRDDHGRWTGGAIPESFGEAKKISEHLNAESDRTGKFMQTFPKGKMGLTPDDVRATPEWQTAKRESEKAFQRLRNFNEQYTKKFAQEIRADRNAKRAARLAPKDSLQDAGGGAVVLLFNSEALSKRHDDIALRTGASWDWPSYEPHLTISYNSPPGIDVSKIEPYRGPIILGPEKFESINENWKSNITEDQQALGFQLSTTGVPSKKKRRKKPGESTNEQYPNGEEE